MAKVKKWVGGRYLFYCPGCKDNHQFNTVPGTNEEGALPVWDFNGDLDKPTVSPSLRMSGPNGTFCHLFMRDGKIAFLDDCAHELAGQTVECPEWED